VSLSAPDLPQGLWFGGASEVGPFNGPAPSSTYSVGADAVTNLFDPTVTSSTGNPWSLLLGLTNTYTPLLLSPGQSGSITVTITPQAPSGTVVSGFLAVETETPFPVNSDIFATFPYTYTVG
jgi:hypothetical protein